MKSKLYKERSKGDFCWAGESDVPTEDQIKLGCIMRIADSLEKIERSYSGLISEVDYHKNLSENRKKLIRKLDHRIAGLKGQITKMKKNNMDCYCKSCGKFIERGTFCSEC